MERGKLGDRSIWCWWREESSSTGAPQLYQKFNTQYHSNNYFLHLFVRTLFVNHRQIKENIPNRVSYPRLDISKPQLGTYTKLGNWDFWIMTTEPEKKIPNYQLGKIWPIGYVRSPITDNIPNWVCFLLVVQYSIYSIIFCGGLKLANVFPNLASPLILFPQTVIPPRLSVCYFFPSPHKQKLVNYQNVKSWLLSLFF